MEIDTGVCWAATSTGADYFYVTYLFWRALPCSGLYYCFCFPQGSASWPPSVDCRGRWAYPSRTQLAWETWAGLDSIQTTASHSCNLKHLGEYSWLSCWGISWWARIAQGYQGLPQGHSRCPALLRMISTSYLCLAFSRGCWDRTIAEGRSNGTCKILRLDSSYCPHCEEGWLHKNLWGL